jgi:hypothetical protein
LDFGLPIFDAEKHDRTSLDAIPGFFIGQSKIQNPKWAGILAIVLALVFGGGAATAQQSGKIFRIGYLDPSTASGSAVLLDAFPARDA